MPRLTWHGHSCFVLEHGGKRIIIDPFLTGNPKADLAAAHAGDTALTTDMKLLEGRVDVMLVPIGDNYTMGIEDAARAVAFVKPAVAIPMHWDTFPVIETDPQAFTQAVGEQAQVVVLQPGRSYDF